MTVPLDVTMPDAAAHDRDNPAACHAAGLALHNQRNFAAAEEVLRDAQARFPDHAGIAGIRGLNALRLEDREAAARLWSEFRQKFPDNALGYVGMADALRKLARLDDFEAVASEGFARFPNSRDIAQQHAAAAVALRKWEEAAVRYTYVRDNFPPAEAIFVALAEAYRHQQQFDRADAVLTEAREKFPNSLDIAMRLARLPGSKGDWLESIRRWNALMTQFATEPSVYAGLSNTLREAGLATLREVVLEGAAARLPESEAVALELGKLRASGSDRAAANRYWRETLKRFQNSEKIRSEFAVSLILEGGFDEAAQVIAEGLAAHPASLWLRVNQGRLAAARAQWAEAVGILAPLAREFPHEPVVNKELGQARYNLELMGGDDGSAHAPAAEDVTGQAPHADGELIDLVTRFSNLGEDCEFGLLQRAVGAEPLGLLRFAGTSPENLIGALRCRFDGVGNPNFFQLHTRPDEYVAADSRFSMIMHTRMSPKSVSYDDAYKMVRRKVQFLARALLEDLHGQDKIFVYKDRWGNLSPRLDELGEILVQYGKPKFLIVKLQEDGKPNGFVERREDGLLVGYIDRHGYAYTGAPWDVPVQSWLTLCRNTLAFLDR